MILNKVNINQHLFHSGGLNEREISEFKELISCYPYASVFVIAYLEALKKVGHIHYEEELSKHAFKITNRVFLYQLLHKESTQSEIAITSEELNELEKTVDNTKIDAVIEIEEILAQEDSETDEERVKVIVPVDDVLDKLIQSSVANTIYINEFNKQEASNPDDSKEIEEVILDNNEIGAQIVTQIDKEPKSFNSWLKMGSAAQKTENEERKSTMIAIEKTKREFYSPSKKAKESIDGNKMPVSETLAKIFVLQGNYPKAIYVYEQLIISFPEKKNIFASQIKQLSKKLIN